MRVLLDECLPRRLKASLPGHEVQTVPERGWAGTKNGELLRLADTEFEVFLTADRNVVHQQRLVDRRLMVISLAAPSNRLADLLPLMSRVREALQTIEPGRVIEIGAEPSD